MMTKLVQRLPNASPQSLNQWRGALLALTIIGSAAFSAQAAAPRIVSVNLLNTTSDNVAMIATTTNNFAGAPGVRAQNWNDIVAGVVSLNPVKDHTGVDVVDGGSVPMGINFTQGGGGARGNITAAPGNNEARMFNGYYDQFENGTSVFLATNIPFASYNVYCYARPDAGGSFRGGFFYLTNTTEKKWIKGGTVSGVTIALPDGNGNGYVESSTATPPSVFGQISAGHFVSFRSVTGATLRVEMSAVGLGANGVSDGDGARRLKVVGFQIVEIPSSGTVTNLSLGASIPNLLSQNPSSFQLLVLGNYDEGFTYPVSAIPSVSYSSSDTSVFTVSSSGGISPKNPGVADLVVTFTNLNLSTISLTQAVTVLGPVSLSVPTMTVSNYFVGLNAADTAQAKLLATFLGSTNVDVTLFNTTQWSTQPAGVASVSGSGLITAVSPGSFKLIGSYGGLSATNTAGVVASVNAPGTVPMLSFNICDSVNLANFKDLSGAPGVRAAYWNNITVSGGAPSNQISNPLDYHGNIQATTKVVVTGRGQNTGTSGTLTTNEAKIFRNYYDAGLNNPAGGPNANFPNTSANEGVIAVTNVPYGKYDVYCYFFNDTGALNRPGHFTAAETGETRWRKNVATLTGGTANITPNETTGLGYLEATPIISGGSIPNLVVPGSLANVPGGNYMKFSNLTNSTLVLNWGADSTDTVLDANTVTRLRLVGFQIVFADIDNAVATNIQLSASVPNLLPGNPTTTTVSPLVNFANGILTYPVSSALGTSYDSSNPSVFTVNSLGVITPGTTPGTANLIVRYTNNVSSVSLTQAVTVLAPLSVKAVGTPKVLYYDAVSGAQTSTLKLLATFNGNTNVDVTAFNTVSFGDYSPAVAGVSGNVATSVAGGLADIGGFYLGTEYVTTNGLTVRSIIAPATLTHRYSFRDAGSTIVDSVGGANGTVFPATGGFNNITLDGERANFPGDATYVNAPYIALPAGLVSEHGDITLEIWGGQNQVKSWARFFGAGSSDKGTDPHNAGNGLTEFHVAPVPGGGNSTRFEYRTNGVVNLLSGTTPFPTGSEQHVVVVYSQAQGVMKLYLNGVLEASDVTVAGRTLQAINDVNVWLGVSLWNDPTLNGWINEIRIHEGVMTDSEVAASYSAGASSGLPVLAQPSLSIVGSGANVQVSWPVVNGGYTLRSNSVLDGVWYPVSGTPTVVGANNVLTVPATGTNVFFILQK